MDEAINYVTANSWAFAIVAVGLVLLVFNVVALLPKKKDPKYFD